MKRLSILSILLIFLSAFTCENEPLEGDFTEENELSCELASQNTQDAAIAFLEVNDSNYTQLCTEYRNALQAQIAFCGDPDGILETQLNSLGSCSNGNQEEEELLGTWLLTAWIAEEPVDLNNDGTGSINLLDEMACYENETLLFNADNTVVNTSTSFASFEFTIEVGTTDSFEYVILCENEVEILNGSWSQSGSTVTITDGFGSTDFTLSGNQLSIFVPEGFFAFNSEDAEVTTTQDLTFVYTKQ